MRKWLLGHRKLVTTCIIVISILLMISSSLLFFKFQKEQNVYVELLYYITQIISSIFVISGVVIAIWQYYLSCMDSNRNIDEYSCAVTPQVRQTGNRLSGLAGTAYASLLT